MQNTISSVRLANYQANTFRTNPSQFLKSIEEAIDFVDERGFIFFWPIKHVLFPSLWTATVGNRPVPNEHDDPGHITWQWKDSLLGTGKWYYAKIIRNKSTIISIEMLPFFYALSNNYGSPEEDYLTSYEQGLLTLEAKIIYETLLKEGPLDTISIRKSAFLSNKESDTRFNKALIDLQVDLKILPVGISQAGRWRYAFVYDVFHHHYSQVIDQAHLINDNIARKELTLAYFSSLGAAKFSELCSFFHWKYLDTEKVVSQLISNKQLISEFNVENSKYKFVGIPNLMNF